MSKSVVYTRSPCFYRSIYQQGLGGQNEVPGIFAFTQPAAMRTLRTALGAAYAALSRTRGPQDSRVGGQRFREFGCRKPYFAHLQEHNHCFTHTHTHSCVKSDRIPEACLLSRSMHR